MLARDALLVVASLGRATGFAVVAPPHSRASYAHVARSAVRLCDTALTPAVDMRMAGLKAELDERGVAWRGVCFDKETLAAALEEARRAPPPPVDATEPSGAGTSSDASAADDASNGGESREDDGSNNSAARYDQEYALAYEESSQLKVKELRAALAERSIGWADCVEKTELVGRLAEAVARSRLFSKSGALTPGRATSVNADDLRAEIADPRTPMLVDVYATWCGPRELQSPHHLMRT